MRPPIALVALTMILTTGCAIGTSLRRFPPAHQAGGAQLTLTDGTQKWVGELLALEAATLLLAVTTDDSTTRLVRVPLEVIASIEGPMWHTQRWTEDDRASLNLFARFPAGITPDLERRLLVTYKADSVRWVES
jgi:hypothetical protein